MAGDVPEASQTNDQARFSNATPIDGASDTNSRSNANEEVSLLKADLVEHDLQIEQLVDHFASVSDVR